jgi:plasmid stability protein
MSSTPTNVVHMSKMIQVRNVPDDMHRALKATALAEGMSLSDYIKRELATIAGQASFEEIDARIQARGPSGLRSETILSALRESRED